MAEDQLQPQYRPLPPAASSQARAIAVRPDDWLGHLRPWIELCERGVEPFLAWRLLAGQRQGSAPGERGGAGRSP